MKYRATPLISGQSPAELYLGRLRLSLDTVFPQNTKQVAQENTSEGGVRLPSKTRAYSR